MKIGVKQILTVVSFVVGSLLTSGVQLIQQKKAVQELGDQLREEFRKPEKKEDIIDSE